MRENYMCCRYYILAFGLLKCPLPRMVFNGGACNKIVLLHTVEASLVSKKCSNGVDFVDSQMQRAWSEAKGCMHIVVANTYITMCYVIILLCLPPPPCILICTVPVVLGAVTLFMLVEFIGKKIILLICCLDMVYYSVGMGEML